MFGEWRTYFCCSYLRRRGVSRKYGWASVPIGIFPAQIACAGVPGYCNDVRENSLWAGSLAHKLVDETLCSSRACMFMLARTELNQITGADRARIAFDVTQPPPPAIGCHEQR